MIVTMHDFPNVLLDHEGFVAVTCMLLVSF